MSNLKITDRGITAPSEQELIKSYLDSINDAFGGGLNTSTLETPQGQLAIIIAAASHAKNNAIIDIANQFNPDFARGRMLDALCELYGIRRKAEIYSTQRVLISATPLDKIPKGQEFSDDAGGLWYTQAEIAVPQSGSVQATLVGRQYNQSLAVGSNLSPSVSTIQIASATTTAITVLGQPIETDEQLRERRRMLVYSSNLSSDAAVRAEVLKIPDVISAYVKSNQTGQTETFGAKSIPANSIYISVLGGDDVDIANAIHKSANGFATYTGSVSVNVADDNIPSSSYTIKFDRATPKGVAVHVDIDRSINNPNYYQVVGDAVYDYIQSERQIGGALYQSNLSCVVNALPNIRITSLRLMVDGSATNIARANLDEYLSIDKESITVTRV